jgi:phage tail tape-measure protein
LDVLGRGGVVPGVECCAFFERGVRFSHGLARHWEEANGRFVSADAEATEAPAAPWSRRMEMSRRTVQRSLGALALAAFLAAAAPAEAGGFTPESLTAGLWSKVWSWVGEWWGSGPVADARDKAHGTIDPNGTPATEGSNPTPPVDPEGSGDYHGTIDPDG